MLTFWQLLQHKLCLTKLKGAGLGLNLFTNVWAIEQLRIVKMAKILSLLVLVFGCLLVILLFKFLLWLIFIKTQIKLLSQAQENDESDDAPTQEPQRDNQDPEPGKVEEPEVQLEDKVTRCKRLNEVRKGFQECCVYPLIVVWRWQYDRCTISCSSQFFSRCCVLVCCLNQMGALQGSNVPQRLNPAALVSSFMLSVQNNTACEPVVKTSVEQCSMKHPEKIEPVQCEVIPGAFYNVLECSYIENFKNCPVWNPLNLEQCNATMQYARECLQ